MNATRTPWQRPPAVRPAPRIVARAYDMTVAGASPDDIARATGADVVHVRRWLDQPDRFSPFVDDVALDRALMFDGRVIARLSLVEFDALCAALNDEGFTPAPFGMLIPEFGTARADAPRTTIDDLPTRDANWYALPMPWRDKIMRRRRQLRTTPAPVLEAHAA